MRRIASAVLLLAFVSLPALAAERNCESDLAALNALYSVRQLVFEPSVARYQIDARIDDLLDELRGPKGDGSYRWVRFVKPAGDAPVIQKEHLVDADYERGDLDSFEAGAKHPFAVRVVVPRKRSTFKANNAVYVGDVTIRYSVDGKSKEMTKTIGQWMSPDTSKTFELPTIADSAEVMIESGTKSKTRRESLVEIHFRQAVAQDDPANPNNETIVVMKRLRSSLAFELTLDAEIAKLEKRLFPGLQPVAFATLAARVREAETLLRSEKTEDVDKGRKMMGDVVKMLPR